MGRKIHIPLRKDQMGDINLIFISIWILIFNYAISFLVSCDIIDQYMQYSLTNETSNHEQLGQVWTHYSNHWILIMIRHLTQKKFEQNCRCYFLDLIPKWFQSKPVKSIPSWHLVAQLQSSEIRKKILVSGPFVIPYSYLAQLTP